MSRALVLRSGRVALPDGTRPAAVVVRDGKITAVTGRGARIGSGSPGGGSPGGAADAEDIDLGEVALLPGLVDVQGHIGGHAPREAGNREAGTGEPGQPAAGFAAGLAAATAAAAAGGVTTFCVMPQGTGPGAATAAGLRARAGAAAGRCASDVAFWGAAVPGNAGELPAMLRAGAAGFCCSLAGPGAAGLAPLGRAGLREAMTALAGTGAPLAVHAEDPAEITEPPGPGYAGFLASRPPVAERRAIETVIAAAAATGARAHIAPLAAAECAALIGAAKAAGIALSAGTCPPYLLLAAGEIERDAPGARWFPPVRYAPNREALWRALEAGVVDAIASGPPPGPPPGCWLPATWTAARRRGRTLADIARWMSAFPASLAGLPAKGAIAPGRDADLVAFDPDAAFVPPGGQALTGRVIAVWLRGQRVLPGSHPPNGRVISRSGRDPGPAAPRAVMGLPAWVIS